MIGRKISRAYALSVALSVGACGGSAKPAASKAVPTAQVAHSRKIVVALVLDQLSSDTFKQALEYLPSDGFFGRAVKQGIFVERARYPYANTYTGPGHATIFTGVPPRIHGISGNANRDPADGSIHAVYDDHGVITPDALQVATVADRLRGEQGDAARIIAMSLKSRATVPGAGRKPNLALWYDSDACGFMTSEFYPHANAPWLKPWGSRDAMARYWRTPWVADAKLAGAFEDSRPGEGDWQGLGTTFPHSPGETEAPCSTFKATPGSAEALLDLAVASLEHVHPTDANLTFLAVSISTTDYIGHVFGPGSLEYMDNLLRIDGMLKRFFAKLQQRYDEVAFVMTSDHGGLPLPESVGGGRMTAAQLVSTAQDALAEHGGQADAFIHPFVHVTLPGDKAARKKAVTAAVAALEALPGVERAFDASELAGAGAPADPLAKAAYYGIEKAVPDGRIFIVPADKFIVDAVPPRGWGTSHGSPWPYDTDVPVLVGGAGKAHCTEVHSQLRVASTLAALLEIRGDGGTAARRAPLLGCDP